MLQKFRSGKNNAFAEEVNKITLNANDDRRIQLIYLIEIHEYGTNDEITQRKEEIKCYNIIKQYKKWLILMMLQNKKQIGIIQIGHNILIIHAKK